MDFHPHANRYPLLEGEAYEAMKADVKEHGIRETVKYRKLQDGSTQGLDGRNRLLMANELGMTCPVEEVDVPDEEVEAYIDSLNLHRRHLDREQKAGLIGYLRSKGESVRAVAAKVGVSTATVQEHDSQVCQIDTPAPTTKGRDGKTYPAKRAATNGAAGGSGKRSTLPREPGIDEEEDEATSNGRKLIGAKQKKKKPPKPPREALQDREGNEVPARCRDAWADEGLPHLMEELAAIESTLRPQAWFDRVSSLVGHYPFLLIDKFREHAFEALRRLQMATEAVEAGMPHAVCPRCQGVEKPTPCRFCRGSGLVPEHRWSELKRESL